MAPSMGPDLIPGFQGLTRSRIPPVQGFRLGGGWDAAIAPLTDYNQVRVVLVVSACLMFSLA